MNVPAAAARCGGLPMALPNAEKIDGIPAFCPSRLKAPIDFGRILCILRGFVETAVFDPGVRIADVMGRTERTREIARRRKRKVQLQKMRTRFEAATSESDKALILAKARRMSPFITLGEAS